jgi:hypothetical protein
MLHTAPIDPLALRHQALGPAVCCERAFFQSKGDQ